MHLLVVGSSHNLSTSNIVDISLTHSNNVLILVVVMGAHFVYKVRWQESNEQKIRRWEYLEYECVEYIFSSGACNMYKITKNAQPPLGNEWMT